MVEKKVPSIPAALRFFRDKLITNIKNNVPDPFKI